MLAARAAADVVVTLGRRLLSALSAGAPAQVAPSDAEASARAAAVREPRREVYKVGCHTCPSSLETDDDF